MKKLIALAFLLGILLSCLFGCAKDPNPTLRYMVDGEVFFEDVIEEDSERFDEVRELPEKTGYIFGGWYYDDGKWEKPLELTVLNGRVENKTYTVYAKWEVVELSFDKTALTYTVTGLLSGAGASVVIPEKVNGYPIVAIADGAFKDVVTLKEITIPNTVKTIGEHAFEGCTALEGVIIPHSVTAIGRYAFTGCSSLASVRLSASINTVSAHLFKDCTALTEVVVFDGVTAVGHASFAGCSSLSSLTLPKSVKTIGTAILSGSALTELTFGGSLDTWSRVEKTDFANASSLTVVRCTNGTVAP
ncbi:MAG: leucine-rich repeat protein [Clostridia bacterium]|nr:leucine-rich repeat protein [Clostridia bacterium]